MKIEFTLNFDEFLEAAELNTYKPKRSFPATLLVIAYIVSACVVLIIGLWTAFSHHEGSLELMQSREKSAGFLVAAVLLFLGIPQVFAWRKRKDPRLAEKTLLDQFQFMKDSPREFETDERGWTYRWPAGEDIRQWNALTSFSEEPSTIILKSGKDTYVLPKRSLTEAQHVELTGLVDQTCQKLSEHSLFTTQVHPSLLDYVLGGATSEPWQYTRLGLGFITAGILICIGLVVYQLLHWDTFEGGGGSLFSAAACTALLVWFLLYPLRFISYYRSHVERNPNSNVAVTSDAIIIWSPASSQILKYNDFAYFRQREHAVLFLYHDGQGLIFPTRGFTSDQLQTLRELLKTKIH